MTHEEQDGKVLAMLSGMETRLHAVEQGLGEQGRLIGLSIADVSKQLAILSTTVATVIHRNPCPSLEKHLESHEEVGRVFWRQVIISAVTVVATLAGAWLLFRLGPK